MVPNDMTLATNVNIVMKPKAWQAISLNTQRPWNMGKNLHNDLKTLRRKRLTLQWHQSGRESVSNHQPHHWLLNRLFRSRSKKTWMLPVTGLCAGGIHRSPHKWPVTWKMCPFDDDIMTRHWPFGFYWSPNKGSVMLYLLTAWTNRPKHEDRNRRWGHNMITPCKESNYR